MSRGRRGGRGSGRGNNGDYLDRAVQQGIGEIIEHHPQFGGVENYLVQHLDKKRLGDKATALFQEAQSRGMHGDAQKDYVQKGIANYIASGEAFDERAKKIILNKSLEEKAKSGFFSGFSARRELESEKYLDNALKGFRDLYTLLQNQEYQHAMPELVDAARDVYMAGMLKPAIAILREEGLIDDRKYKQLRTKLNEKAKRGTQRTTEAIEHYANYEQVAAGIFGIGGVALLLISISGNITGNVIGNLNKDWNFGFLFGGVLLLFLSYFIFRKK